METASPIKYKIVLVALSKTIEMEMTSSLEVVREFFLLFPTKVNEEEKKTIIDSLQQNTEELKNNFKNFVERYKDREPKLNQLNTFFNALETDEHFYLIVNQDVDVDAHIELSNMLAAIREGKTYEEIKGQMDDLFKELRQQYDLRTFDKSTKQSIGEKDKSKRVCRFCSKSSPDVTFISVAHAVSEALGNKGIVLNEECDNCNNIFGSKVEIDLIEYLRFFCVWYGIKGKEKIPEIKSPKLPVTEETKNFAVKNEGENKIKIDYYQTDDSENEREGFPINLPLRTGQEIIPQNVYKTLCKYALSVIDSKHIPAFKETIKWLNGDITIEKLPEVAMLVTNSFFDRHPRLTLYIRKNDNHDLPFLVGELNFTALTFSFIVPLCGNDKKYFLEKGEYENYWKTFKHYSLIKEWRFLDLSEKEKKKLTYKVNIVVPEKPSKK